MNKISILLFFFQVLIVNSQKLLKGTVKDIQNNPIAYGNILIKENTTKKIVAYTSTNQKGEYQISVPSKKKLYIKVTSLGYKAVSVAIDSLNIKKNKNFILIEETLQLNEVFIEAQKSIVIKNDTIRYKASSFKQGNEQSIEDLLKKIPGITVDNDGVIKVGKQEIDKLMVDGEDFFERGYQILSKNMPSDPIDEIEVLKNYSNNSLLKGIEESNKIALNLKLNEKAKRVWFGNVEANSGIGNSSFYNLKTNLMNFGKKSKHYLLTNFNTVGFNATGNILNLIAPYRQDEISIGDTQKFYNVLNIAAPVTDFKKSRTNFNNSKLVSLNTIVNITKKIKIKTLAFVNWDKTDLFNSSTTSINTKELSFTNYEKQKFRNQKRTTFAKVDFFYNISKKAKIKSTTKYSSNVEGSVTDLIFNGNSTIQNLENKYTLFDEKIVCTNKINKSKVFLLTGRFIDKKAPQKYRTNQFFYQNLLPKFSKGNNVKQTANNHMQFIGFNAHLLNRKKNKDLLELQVGNQYRTDILNTKFSLLKENILLSTPKGYQNKTSYQINDTYLKGKYVYKIDNFDLIGNLEIHTIFNQLKNRTKTSKNTPFFINPKIALNWVVNKKNNVRLSYSYTTKNANILDVYNGYVLKGFRYFSKGTGAFNQLEASNVTFNYQLGNWNSSFFTDFFITYKKNHDFFSTNAQVTQNFYQYEKTISKNSDVLYVSYKIEYYFKSLASNLRLNLNYSKSKFNNTVNNSKQRNIITNNYNYQLELRSGFNGVFNYHIGTKWIRSRTKVNTNIFKALSNVSFLDLLFKIDNNLTFEIKNERYLFGNSKVNTAYYFSDFEVNYKFKKYKKLNVGLTGKNLLNIKNFNKYSINDVSTSKIEYKLLPRFILLKIKYSF
ncbi:carboxypeptidase-like regulatory domain-containing protein [Tenacibaculum finnmarkense]|uniref:carboxypeptidase-like regulatory domain-containing protein n=1 Tax=Tenacibaculum finnmarkense TaxID=2781243 RepID=UPI000C6A2B44|nr:carboxypeptidase-like regulatory domain-containing protein [Tenacibaculum finnmarkense]MCD8439377.1 carboxypeptidase-like regulatory domain-containing protein [Tenacibaculum finnmarkense genomovar ulcerans]MCG8720225.1 TonB-dependent receptor [Tenacibaculum finnmarkense]SOS56235.1 conserved hypothetical protein [Tenacibaculum finnmarkense]